ncbi:hypothetical protein [uncultured Desulfobacter sp.]|uniref:hypothetical protein n=1 Tax=uncultured Desulfobacter sp. TaxID=240139 RepID=UPI0029F54E5D|nr:hypothetical protein [uncultured Desulfobacter sp.]
MKHLLIILIIALALTWYCQLVSTQTEMKTIQNEECKVCQQRTVDEFFLSPPRDTRFYKFTFPADPDLAADLVWMKTAYYYGIIDISKPEDFFYLPFLLSTITDLAPEWKFPYFFGSYTLLFEANMEKQGLKFIEKGMASLPELWELWLMKGYYFIKYKKDFKQAALIFAEASTKQRAPKYLAALSVSLALKGNERSLAEQLAKIFQATINDKNITRRIAEKFK